MGGSRGGTGVRTPLPLKYHKNIGFLNNTSPDPLKNHKATKPAFNVGPPSAAAKHHLNGVCWQADVGPLIVAFEMNPLSPHQLKIKRKKLSQSWTPSEKTFWIRACLFKKCPNPYRNIWSLAHTCGTRAAILRL